MPTNYLEILTVAHVGCRKSGLILLGVLQYMDHSMLRSMIYVPPAAGNPHMAIQPIQQGSWWESSTYMFRLQGCEFDILGV